MSNNQLTDKIVQIFVKNFGKDLASIDNSATFAELSLDELDKIESIMRAEDEFNVEISDNEADSINSIPDLIACIESKLA